MKIRGDFVTNSSSSSFVVAIRSEDVLAEKRARYKDDPFVLKFLDLAERFLWNQPAENTIHTEEELTDYFLKDYDLEAIGELLNTEDRWMKRTKELYEKCLARLKDGWEIRTYCLDWHEDKMQGELFSWLPDGETLDVLEGEMEG